jgi:hypothetical protein
MDLEVWTDTAVDQWLYKAAILDGPQGCDLKVNEGGSVIKETAPIYHDVGKNPDTITATRVGHGFDFHDTMGNTMSTVLTNGYRLFCSSFPSNTSIQLVFAVVSVQSRYLPSEAPAPGTWKMGVVPAGVDLIDQLDKRPFPPAVKIYKNYVRALRKFSSDAVIVRVRNGD